MSLGVLLSSISSLSLALTIVTDKLMLGDFYQSDPRKAWFISSFVGATLGLLATAIAWIFFADPGLSTSVKTFATEEYLLLAITVVAGVLVSLNLRTYFECMNQNTVSASVAIIITATPIFIYATQLTLHGELLTFGHALSVLVTVFGMIGFELSAGHHKKSGRSLGLLLLIFVVLSTAYVIILDELFPRIETALNLDSIQASLVAMSFYWIGFATGSLTILHKEVRGFVVKMFSGGKFLLVILATELIGASFYFFEFFGLAKMNATLLALIVGAHIVAVWLSDLYIRKRYQSAIEHDMNETKILFFRIPTKDLTAYNIVDKTLILQGGFIILTLLGLALWP